MMKMIQIKKILTQNCQINKILTKFQKINNY